MWVLQIATRAWLAAVLVLAVLAPAAANAQTVPIPGQAAPTPAAVGCQPGPEANQDPSFCDGVIDSPATGDHLRIDRSFTVSGWMIDRTAQGWAGFDAVHVYEGLAGAGRLLAVGNVSISRPDVASALGNPDWASAGFQAVVPGGLLALGDTVLTVYLHSPSKGWWYKQVSVTVDRPHFAQPVLAVQKPQPTEKVKTNQDYTIVGYALDPGARDDTGVDRVDIYIRAERGGADSIRLGWANIGDENAEAAEIYGERFRNTGWKLTFRPSDFKTGNTQLFIYARSTDTAGETLVTVDINLVDK